MNTSQGALSYKNPVHTIEWKLLAILAFNVKDYPLPAISYLPKNVVIQLNALIVRVR